MMVYLRTICLLGMLYTSLFGKEKPNVILIVVDDLGWADISGNNPDNRNTPNIGSLAAGGVRYTDYHSTSSICTPSRAGLLTGRLGQRTGVTQNFSYHSVGGLPRTEKTLADYMKTAGYRTAIIGKWHLGHTDGYNPVARGFDYYYGVPYSISGACFLCQPLYNIQEKSTCPNSYHIGMPLLENETIIEQPVDLNTLSGRLSEKARHFMTEAVEEASPFFLYLALTQVHVPLATSRQFANKSGDGPFGDVLMEMDHTVGEMMSFVQQHNITNNTLIIFTSDNGPWTEKCQYAGSSAPYTGRWETVSGQGGGTQKETTWEGGFRVPFIVSWPGVISPGVSKELVSALDIVPTLSLVSGFTLPSDRDFDGIPLALLAGSARDNNTTRLLHLFLAHPHYGVNSWNLRYGKYKIFYLTSSAAGCAARNSSMEFVEHDQVPLVFDTEEDPGEEYALTMDSEFYETVGRLKLETVESIRAGFKSRVNWDTADWTWLCCDRHNLYCSCTPVLEDTRLDEH